MAIKSTITGSTAINATINKPDTVKTTSAVLQQSRASLSLENVDNTRDLDKPISTATQTALDLKLDKDSNSPLTITHDGQGIKLSGASTAPDGTTFVGLFKNSGDSRSAYIGYPTANSSDLVIAQEISDSDIIFNVPASADQFKFQTGTGPLASTPMTISQTNGVTISTDANLNGVAKFTTIQASNGFQYRYIRGAVSSGSGAGAIAMAIPPAGSQPTIVYHQGTIVLRTHSDGIKVDGLSGEGQGTLIAKTLNLGANANITGDLSVTGNITDPTFTGTISGLDKSDVGLDNVTNESKATMFTDPTFTGTISGLDKSDVGLDNVTNESKATMFSNPTFTGNMVGKTLLLHNSPDSPDGPFLGGAELRIKSIGSAADPSYNNRVITGTDLILKANTLKIPNEVISGENEHIPNQYGFDYTFSGITHTLNIGNADAGGNAGPGPTAVNINGKQTDLNITSVEGSGAAQRAKLTMTAGTNGPAIIDMTGTDNSYIELKNAGSTNFKVNVDDEQQGTTMNVGPLRIVAVGGSDADVTFSNTSLSTAEQHKIIFNDAVQFKQAFKVGLDANNNAAVAKPLQRGIVTSDVRVVNSSFFFDKRRAAREAAIEPAARFTGMQRTNTQFKIQTLNSPSDSPDGSPSTTSTDYKATVGATGVSRHAWSIADTEKLVLTSAGIDTTLQSTVVATTQSAGDNSNKVATTAFVKTAIANNSPNYEELNVTNLNVSGTATGISKSMVGLGNVDNESKSTLFTSAALTGTPTAPTASAATNNTQIATTAYTTTAINNLIDSAPGTLNTLNEIAEALNDSPAQIDNILSAVGQRLVIGNNLSDLNNAGTARTNLGLGNVTNESKATMFTDPTFTGTVSGVTASHVGLGNVTNESKATMFSNPTFTGNVDLSRIAGANNITIQPDTASGGYDISIKGGTSNNGTGGDVNIQAGAEGGDADGPGSINIGTDDVDRITIGTTGGNDYTVNSSSAFRTAISLGNVTNESKATMFSSPTFTGTVSGVTASHVGLGNVTNESKATMFSNPTFTGTVSGVTASHVGLGNVTNESKATMFSGSTFTGTTTATGITMPDSDGIGSFQGFPSLLNLQASDESRWVYNFGNNTWGSSYIKGWYISNTGDLNLANYGDNTHDPQMTWGNDGTVTIPNNLLVGDKIVHSGDTNTAIRFPSNDAITFETDGTERMRIQSDGTIDIDEMTIDGNNAVKINSSFTSAPVSIGYTGTVGSYSVAIGSYSANVGASISAPGGNQVAIGAGGIINSGATFAIGIGSYFNLNNAAADNAIGIGTYATATNQYTIGIGFNAQAKGNASIAIGKYSIIHASAADAIAIGNNADANNANSIRAIAIGHDTDANGTDSMAIGTNAQSTATSAIAIGHDTDATALKAVAIGDSAQATGAQAIAVGDRANVSATRGVAIGYRSDQDATNSVVIGHRIKNTVNSVSEIGYWSDATTRGGAVRIHGETGQVSATIQNLDSPYSDGGATKGSEADGTLMREGYSFRRNSSNLFLDLNVGGTVTTKDIGPFADDLATLKLSVQDKSADYTLVAGDTGTLINGTASAFDALSIDADLGAGFSCTVINPNADVIITASNSMSINGTSNGSVTLQQGYQPATIVRIGSDSYAIFGNLS